MQISSNNIIEIAEHKTSVFFSLMQGELTEEVKLRYRAEARAELETLLQVVRWSKAEANDKARAETEIKKMHKKVQDYIDVILPLSKQA